LRAAQNSCYGSGMDHSPSPGPGLRERKKQATRAALSWAAVRLAVERGLDAVLVEDIAAAAGVSPRTFNNYFASKAEAIAARHVDRVRELADVLRARPADEPLWDAVTAAALGQFGEGGSGRNGTPGALAQVGEGGSGRNGTGQSGPEPEWLAGVRLMVSEPALQGELVRAYAAAEGELTDAIAERTGSDPDRDLYPRLVAATVGAAIQAASAQWLRADPPVPLAPLVREALSQVAAGLPPPTNR
jgi:AcrR family transcriptional regulator